MSEFEIVERPSGGRGKGGGNSSRAVLQSAETGQAVRLPLKGTTAHTLRSRFGSMCRTHGLVLHTRVDGEFLIAWAEKEEQV